MSIVIDGATDGPPGLSNDSFRGRFGLDGTAVNRINGVFADFPQIHKVILYGSRAKGNYRPGSDIDLTIVGGNATEWEMLEMDNRLEALLLPYTIDLSLFHRIRNRALIDHIERAGVVFFEQGRDDFRESCTRRNGMIHAEA